MLHNPDVAFKALKILRQDTKGGAKQIDSSAFWAALFWLSVIGFLWIVANHPTGLWI